MSVRDQMGSPEETITFGTSLQDARILLDKHRFQRLPVAGEKDRPVGIESERDLLYASPPPATWLNGLELNHLLAKLQTQEIINREVVTTTHDTFVDDSTRPLEGSKTVGLRVAEHDNQVEDAITETGVFRTFIDSHAAGHPGLYRP